MPLSLDVPVPLLLDFANVNVEEIAILCVSILVAVTISAESQAFVATFLGDSRSDQKKRHHFNAFLHLDPLGTISFFLGGFGWAKEVEVDAAGFKHPRLYLLLSRLAGPLGNFMLASIAASVVWLFGQFAVQDKVFSGLVVVNMMVAVYGLIIIPPLPGAVLLSILLPDTPQWRRFLSFFQRISPFLLVLFLLVMRIWHSDFSGFFLNSVVRSLCGILLTSPV